MVFGTVIRLHFLHALTMFAGVKVQTEGESERGSRYSITDRRVPELIPDLGSQPAGDVSHKPGGRLPLLSARPATLKSVATNFAVW